MPGSPTISLVVAMAENRVIGRDGGLPWHLPDDLRHFKEVTLGKTVIMGRKTFESIVERLGRPLRKRRSVVLTRDRGYRYRGPGAGRVTVVPSFERALAAVAEEAEAFVIGGAAVFARALPAARRLHLTLVHAEPAGDVRFPELDLGDWQLLREEHHGADPRHAHPFSFRLYQRREPPAGVADDGDGDAAASEVLTCGELAAGTLGDLLAVYGLELRMVEDGGPIPGSHWGAPEAGLLGPAVFVRADTPVHSALHEAGHSICMGEERRRTLDTDAGGDDLEEGAVCYLQILLADLLPGVGRQRLMADMDRWGYSFRLGSTRAWFESDAEDARRWLVDRGLVDVVGQLRPPVRP